MPRRGWMAVVVSVVTLTSTLPSSSERPAATAVCQGRSAVRATSAAARSGTSSKLVTRASGRAACACSAHSPAWAPTSHTSSGPPVHHEAKVRSAKASPLPAKSQLSSFHHRLRKAVASRAARAARPRPGPSQGPRRVAHPRGLGWASWTRTVRGRRRAAGRARRRGGDGHLRPPAPPQRLHPRHVRRDARAVRRAGHRPLGARAGAARRRRPGVRGGQRDLRLPRPRRRGLRGLDPLAAGGAARAAAGHRRGRRRRLRGRRAGGGDPLRPAGGDPPLPLRLPDRADPGQRAGRRASSTAARP